MTTPTITNNTQAANGSCLQGYCKTEYNTLVEKLGEPLTGFSGDGKVTCEWIIEFPDNTVGTIYDWKTGETPKEEYNWHIGGKGVNVVEKVGEFLNLPTTESRV